MSSKKSSVAQLPVKGELASSREEEREELLELNDRLEAYGEFYIFGENSK